MTSKGKLGISRRDSCSRLFFKKSGASLRTPEGSEAAKKFASAVVDNIPDRQITHEDTIAKGNKVLI
jgi:hypothetical protein